MSLSLFKRSIRSPITSESSIVVPFNPVLNSGIVLEFDSGVESIVSPISGRITDIKRVVQSWGNSLGLSNNVAERVTITYGSGRKVVLDGIQDVKVSVGKVVSRGEFLGYSQSKYLNFSVLIDNSGVNPLSLNSRMHPRLSFTALEKRVLQSSPCVIDKDYSTGIISSTLHGSRIYDYPGLGIRPFSINVRIGSHKDFYGKAASGMSNTDFWNVYLPEEFNISVRNSCGLPGSMSTSRKGIYLKNNFSQDSTAYLSRNSNLSGDYFSDNTVTFSNLYASGMGSEGDTGSFSVHQLVTGNYDFYFYGNKKSGLYSTSIVLTKNELSPESKSTNPTGIGYYLENDNYVKFSKSVLYSDIVEFSYTGYLSGFQIVRV